MALAFSDVLRLPRRQQASRPYHRLLEVDYYSQPIWRPPEKAEEEDEDGTPPTPAFRASFKRIWCYGRLTIQLTFAELRKRL